MCFSAFEKVSQDILQSSSHFCQPNPESRNNPVCDKSNSYSMKTWKERVYGLTVRYLKNNKYPFEVECNVPMNLPPPVEEASDNVFNYNCTLKREVVSGYIFEDNIFKHKCIFFVYLLSRH